MFWKLFVDIILSKSQFHLNLEFKTSPQNHEGKQEAERR